MLMQGAKSLYTYGQVLGRREKNLADTPFALEGCDKFLFLGVGVRNNPLFHRKVRVSDSMQQR